MDETSTISVPDAYRAMCNFVETYWKRGNRAGLDDPIECLLSDIQFGAAGPTNPADPAQWQDFLDAVRRVAQ